MEQKRMKHLLASLAILLGCAACSAPDATDYPPLPIVRPFAMDKAGNTISIDFWVGRKVNIERRLMVGLDFPQTEDGSIEQALEQGQHKVELKVARVENGKLVPLKVEDDDAILAAADGHPKPATPLCRLDPYAHDGQTSNALICGFHVHARGHYVAHIRTVEDMPMFKGVRTVVTLGEFYNTGK